ncbi:MAG: hypothetical protein P1P82_10025 [Bacteroidales bacterium]|nr:hypothetical protein [Bacteroidales bacterium]MDT8431279.1 hypothetical protein [Bacteroidales bacterium]
MRIRIGEHKKIIIDADVIIHFSKADQLGILHTIYPNQIYLLDFVFKEVFMGNLKIQVENMIRFGFLQELEFNDDIKVLREFALLKRKFGTGESACMAYCRFHDDVLASSNLKDIKKYCEQHKIQYLTTMDFLLTAYDKGILAESECDQFITDVLSKGSKLPYTNIKKYIESM